MANEVTHNQIQNALHNDMSQILSAPRITEKAAMGTTNHVYTFNVPMSANKIQIKQAVKTVYNVEPVKVNIVTQRATKTSFRGRRGMSKAYKKAIVFLKEGDTIEL